MTFITVAQNITSILGSAAAGRYKVIGYQSQSDDASEYKNNNRLVRVYYSEGTYPRNSGGISGPVMHDATFDIELSVTMSAEGDLATLNDPLSTPLQLQTALAGVKTAEQSANESWDELYNIVFGVIMDARNVDLGMSVGDIADRWIAQSKKDEPLRVGGLVMITGIAQLEVRIDEPILGETGTASGKIYDTTIDVENDDNERTGVSIDTNP
jgi:hypothetical protein